ncbi:unnamed protein product [Leptidea sinapis]|uniref:Down syndrome cell adhesion molecule-like protein Dscam2 n=1 Tax=Leptidea sinapis TaxID=189913 RepID=A0A5E4QCT8_9NEOP|nr:unnamed protein product [Leptidea sinapis]
MDVSWQVAVSNTPGVAGGAALLTCAVSPTAARAHVSVTGWLKDGAHITPLLTDTVHERRLKLTRAQDGGYIIAGSRGDILVVRDASPEDRSSYCCEAQHMLTGDKRRSPPSMISVTHGTGSMAPRILAISEDETVQQGGDIRLVCCAIGSPPPTYSSVTFQCSVEGGEARVRWLHDGVPVGGAERSLVVRGVARAHRGMYQCFAERDLDSAQAAAELRLGDTAPELHYTFIEQALHPGPAVALRCSASGSPPPRFTWLLDSLPIEEHNTPQSEIRWQRNGVEVSASGGRALAGPHGELLLWPAEPADAGLYSCRVTASSGHYAQKDLQIFVRNPPKIAGFSFPADLVEGSSIQVLCGITSGDKPVYFSWLKDGQTVPANLQLQLLLPSVAPTWVFEPQDVSALLSTPIVAHCLTKGYPEPRITWLRGHEPAQFEQSSRNVSARRTASVTLACAARGDPPLTLRWSHNTRPLDLHTYRVSVSEKRSENGASSELSIAHAQRSDSGVYRCRAENARESSEPDAEVTLEYRVDNLRPATAYALRLAAVNDIGESDYSDTIIVNTLEEGGAVRLGGLAARARYELRLRAFNSVGAGPAADSLAATTLEDVPEGSPQHVRCEAVSSQSLRVWWEPPPAEQRGGIILGYEISYRCDNDIQNRIGYHSSEVVLVSEQHQDDEHQMVVEGLGQQLYELWVTATTAAGEGEMSTRVAARPSTKVSKAALEKHLLTTNSSCVRLNLLSWDSNGCPLIHFIVSIRGFDESAWRSESLELTSEPTSFCGLTSATWYHLRVVATGTAGVTTATYYFSTLTVTGGLILSRSSSRKCFRNGYEASRVSEEDKSVEKRDNRRNCQQVYTSSPIKCPKKEQQEMYEISPYATFSMAGGAVCETGETGGAGAGAAAGAAAVTVAGGGSSAGYQCIVKILCWLTVSDEYTLSRAMTLMVRRAESDSDSSGSPCAECNSAIAYRMPLAPAKGTAAYKAVTEEVFRAVTDSSAESCTSGSRDKSRRRPRRHHTPNSSRYPQRQEQERRDFTIHV